ncbi:MAG: hypothetical protein HZA22_06125 [Nitrospirae bacterium]|nr:hypothetical protein [Nitrospirota bacterium]MBI5694690.1 hypothetical protein [Nitrospirota bacterium]
MRDCTLDKNKKSCTCTYEPCPRKGICCECVAYHRKSGEIPGCFFPPEGERSYDRSIENFIKAHTR